jgi:hypothetical protein
MSAGGGRARLARPPSAGRTVLHQRTGWFERVALDLDRRGRRSKRGHLLWVDRSLIYRPHSLRGRVEHLRFFARQSSPFGTLHENAHACASEINRCPGVGPVVDPLRGTAATHAFQNFCICMRAVYYDAIRVPLAWWQQVSLHCLAEILKGGQSLGCDVWRCHHRDDGEQHRPNGLSGRELHIHDFIPDCRGLHESRDSALPWPGRR